MSRSAHHIASNSHPKTSTVLWDNTAEAAGVPANAPAAMTKFDSCSHSNAPATLGLTPSNSSNPLGTSLLPSGTAPLASNTQPPTIVC
jgi:hypothetical protein